MQIIVEGIHKRDLRIREFKRHFVQHGVFPGDPSEVVKREVLLSWTRSLEAKLLPSGRPRTLGSNGSTALREARERNHYFLSQCRGTLAHVGEQIHGSNSLLLLTDSRGMIIDSVGNPQPGAMPEPCPLLPGTSWNEAEQGTNAIGTAIAGAAPTEILGSEHFLDCYAPLCSSAAPILDPKGRLIGTVAQSSLLGAYQAHGLGLVRLTAQMLERRLFEAEHRDSILIAFHAQPESVGTLQDGLIAFSPEGAVLGANSVALKVLGESGARLQQLDFELLFAMPFGQYMDRAGHDGHTLILLPCNKGGRYYSMVRSRGRFPRSLPSLPDEPASPSRISGERRAASKTSLDALDTGDPELSLALSRAKRIVGKDIPLLILGESGVGKEMFAKAFHVSGPRRLGPFVALNCAAIPENLIESELFGYVGGAFTGARREGYVGKIQQASGGTLFLDEIGDMPLNLQARLLRVLQERALTPLGGAKLIPVDFSLVCATHRQLTVAIKEGLFRQDLFYRVNGLSVTLPPLRRRQDIRQIVETLLRQEVREGRRISLSEPVDELFHRYPWPGNVRQLQSVLRVALALLGDDRDCITTECLPDELLSGTATDAKVVESASGAAPPENRLPATLDQMEVQAIENVLAQCHGNISAAARVLGISRNTLYRKLGRQL